MRRLETAFLLAAVLPAACIESNPQPSPEADDKTPVGFDDASTAPWSPDPADSDLMLVSAAGNEGTVLVVGDQGAAPGAEGVEVDWGEDAPPDDFSASAAVDTEGGFAVVLTGFGQAELTLVFSYPDSDLTQAVDLAVPEIGAAGGDRPWAWDGKAEEQDANATPPPDPEFGGALGDDLIAVTVSGPGAATVTGAPFSVTPLAQVAVVNETSPAQAITQADVEGSFSVTLAAQPGDVLRLFAVNPQDHSKATQPMLLDVP